MRYQGKITSWKDEKGFGFITPNDGGSQVFVHVNSFANRQNRPIGNEIVTYELKIDAKGRAQAESVAFKGERVRMDSSPRRSNVSLIVATAFLLFVVWSTFSGQLPLAVLELYLVASIVTFIAYALDKSAARNDQWRTQESTLHLFALIGGWPGALAAQRLLRHKSKKQSFQILFWITVVLNCGTLGRFFSPSGAKALRTFLGTARSLIRSLAS
jgi:uncharacterized membrane protein YsdA (DUF1294 family)/cold shock CspA family protein